MARVQSQSGLSWVKRFKAVLPVLIALATVIGYNVYIHRGEKFVLTQLPQDRTLVMFVLINAGLDRIKAAGCQPSWDQRPVPPPPPDPRLMEAERERQEREREAERQRLLKE